MVIMGLQSIVFREDSRIRWCQLEADTAEPELARDPKNPSEGVVHIVYNDDQ